MPYSDLTVEAAATTLHDEAGEPNRTFWYSETERVLNLEANLFNVMYSMYQARRYIASGGYKTPTYRRPSHGPDLAFEAYILASLTSINGASSSTCEAR